MDELKIRTVNPQALADTLLALPGGLHVVQVDTWDGDVVTVETTNPGFLRFACVNQGYGEVVDG